jgi:hypothetical protein
VAQLLHSLFGKMNSGRYKYDAFISHAVEDKLPVANELCARLEAAGLKIWYSGRELSVGDRISDAIEEGLRNSRFGIVILSPTYISKDWTMREFYSLLSRSDYRKVILPILYDITPKELLSKDITMADTFALRADKGMDYLVEVLTAEIGRQKRDSGIRRQNVGRRRFIGLGIGLLMVAGIGTAYIYLGENTPGNEDAPTPALIERLVSKRLQALQTKADGLFQEQGFVTKTSTFQVESDVKEYSELRTHYRNEYRLDNGYVEIQSKKNVEAALQLDFDRLTLRNGYGFTAAETFRQDLSDGKRVVRYLYRNSKPVGVKIGELTQVTDETWVFDVDFSDNLMLVETILSFPGMDDEDPRKRQQVRIFATLPTERYLLRKEGSSWTIHYYPDP